VRLAAELGSEGGDEGKDFGEEVVGMSSSEKSMLASRRAAARKALARQASALAPSAPEKTRSAWRRWASVSASRRAARPST
jgi:hypothetical protein